MSTDTFIIDCQKTEIDLEDESEEKKRNAELYMTAEMDPSINDDQNQNKLQRRHFSNKMSSDIFFRNAPTEGNVSSGNANVDREELLFPSAGHYARYEAMYEAVSESNANKEGTLSEKAKSTGDETDETDQNQTDKRHFHQETSVDRGELLNPSAGHFTPYADEKEGERRHFDSPSKVNMQTESNATQDEAAAVSKSDNMIEVESDTVDKNQMNKQHFHGKTSSDIFFRHLPSEGTVSSGSSTVDREELIYPSAGHFTRYAAGKEFERRHYDSPSKVNMQTESNASQGEAADVSKSDNMKKVESLTANMNQTNRQHFHEKTGMKSDIFFRNLPAEGTVSSGSSSVDREELLYPSAGHFTRHAAGTDGERRHFDAPSKVNMQTESSATQDEAADLSKSYNMMKVESDTVDKNQTNGQHFHENNVPSAGHFTCYADGKDGERQHFDSPSKVNMQTESNATQDDDSSSSDSDVVKNKTQRHHFHEKNKSDIFFNDSPSEGNVSSGSATVDREEVIYPSAGHFTRCAARKDDATQTIKTAGVETDEADQHLFNKCHYHGKTSSDIFFRHAPAKGISGCTCVNREELFSSTGLERYPDPSKEGGEPWRT